ncbi:MAG: hypothetical protein EOP06_09600 [Proteobacteria bacterium]|nr:MAG: hypothetical protein EOP06_09600 [Pseudomonadota bacterium]
MTDKNASLTFGIEPDAYPLNEQIILRSGVAVFESQTSTIPASSRDCGFLTSIVFGNCFLGASDFPIYPFVCAPNRSLTGLATAAVVLSELRITNFQTEHINDFDSTQIPYPGYHPGTENDEIHTDRGKQYMFAPEMSDHLDTDFTGKNADLSRVSHSALRSYVLSHHLFYILIHDKPKPYEDFMFSQLVLLFALGVSPATGNLVGAVSSQVCHNLCD